MYSILKVNSSDAAEEYLYRWNGGKALAHLGGVHGKHVSLCRLVLAALAHHQHEVLLAASKRQHALVRVGHQRFLGADVQYTTHLEYTNIHSASSYQKHSFYF